MQYSALMLLAVSAIGPNAFALPANTLPAAASFAASTPDLDTGLHRDGYGPIHPNVHGDIQKREDCVAHPNLPKCNGENAPPLSPADVAKVVANGVSAAVGGPPLKREVESELKKRYDCVAHPNLPKCNGAGSVSPGGAAQIGLEGAANVADAALNVLPRDERDLQRRYDCQAHPNLPKCDGESLTPVTPGGAAQIGVQVAQDVGEAAARIIPRDEIQKREDCVAHPNLPKCQGAGLVTPTGAANHGAQADPQNPPPIGPYGPGAPAKRDVDAGLEKRVDCNAHPNLPGCLKYASTTYYVGPWGKRNAEPTAVPEALEKRVDCNAHPNLPGCLKYASTTYYVGPWDKRSAEPTAAPEAAALDKRVDCAAHPNLPQCILSMETVLGPLPTPAGAAKEKRVDCGAHPNLPGCLKYASTTYYVGPWGKRSVATGTPTTTSGSTSAGTSQVTEAVEVEKAS